MKGILHGFANQRLLQECSLLLVVHGVGEVHHSGTQFPPLRQLPLALHVQKHPQNWGHLPLTHSLSMPLIQCRASLKAHVRPAKPGSPSRACSIVSSACQCPNRGVSL